MQPENMSRLKKIERISLFLRGLCKIVMTYYVLIELVMLWGMFGGAGHDFMGANYVNFHIHELAVRDRFLVGVMWTLTGGAMFKAVFHIHQLLGHYSSGEIFTKGAAGQIRQWGLACMAWGILKLMWLSVPQIIPATHHVAGTGILGGLGMIVDGLIILGFSWFTEVGVEMREEQELTV